MSATPKIITTVLITTLLLACGGKTSITGYEDRVYHLDDSTIVPDQAALDMIAPYKARLDSTMNVVLNYAERSLTKGQPESPLGNFMADLCYVVGNDHYEPADGIYAHMCILNNGGIRSTIPEGEITLGRVYELMPFENELVVLTISGEKTLEMFNYMNHANGVPMANATFRILTSGPDDIMIGGQPIDATQSYKVITSDYLANGGDKYDFFADPIAYEYTGIKVRDAIIEYLNYEFEQGRSINADYDGRVQKD